jgi:hypothetical protein
MGRRTVASIEAIISGLQGVTDKLDEARNATNAVTSDTDDAINQATELGAVHLANTLSQVKDAIDKGTNQISAAIGIFSEAIMQARAAIDGT